MRADDPALHPEAFGLPGQGLDMAGIGVVGLVAVEVDEEAALGRSLAEGLHRPGAVVRGALEVGDASDHVHPPVEGPGHVVGRAPVAVVAVLREGDELEVDPRGELLAELEQRVHRHQRFVGHVHVAPDREAPPGDRPVAELAGPALHVLRGEGRDEVAPDLDALEQGAAAVDAGPARAQGRVEMEVGVDEGRGDEPAVEGQGLAGRRLDAGRHLGDAPVPDGDVDADAAVG